MSDNGGDLDSVPDPAGEVDPDGALADDLLRLPDDLFGAVDLFPGRTAAEGSAEDPSSTSSGFAYEGLWGEQSDADTDAGAELPGESPADDGPLFPEPGDVEIAGEVASTAPEVRASPRRPTLAPPTVAERRRRSGVPRRPGRSRLKQVVAAVALVAASGVGLQAMRATRGGDAPQQVDAAGVRPTSTVLASVVVTSPAASTTTSVVLAPVAVDPPPVVPSTAVSSPPATPATTVPFQSPARSASTVTLAAPAAPAPPAPTVAPPPPTVAEPPPTTTPAPPATDPPPPVESTSTTRRPRPAAPDTTVPASTTSTTTSLPVVEAD